MLPKVYLHLPMRPAPSPARLSRLHLPPKEMPSLGDQLTRSLLHPRALLVYAMSLQERAAAEDGNLYFVTINLHAGQRAEAAVAAAERMLNSLMEFAWRWAAGDTAPSCLGSAAAGARPLAAITPEQEAAGGYHSHGFLYIPSGRLRALSGGRYFSQPWVHLGLRVVRDCRRLGLEPLLHPESADLIQIHPFEDLRNYSGYSTAGWCPWQVDGSVIELLPAGKVAGDWHPVSRRAGVIIQQLEEEARSAGESAVAREGYLSAVARGQQPPTLPRRSAKGFRWKVPGGFHEWSELFTRPAHLYP